MSSNVHTFHEKTRARELFDDFQRTIHQKTDRLFVILMSFQWFGGIVAALIITPDAWDGAFSRPQNHVWIAVFIGGLITSLPVYLCLKQPGQSLNRQVVAVSQMLTSALLIYLTGGKFETHFHVFGSLAFLAFYRDWKVILTASIVVTVTHFTLDHWWPQIEHGALVVDKWHWLELAAWVIFVNIFLIIAIRQSINDMRNVAERQANIENLNLTVEKRVDERTRALQTEVLERKKAEYALRLREALLNSTLESTADGILVVDPQGQVTHYNKKFQEMWRIPDEIMQTKSVFEMRDYVRNQLTDEGKLAESIDDLLKRATESMDTLEFKDGRVYERYSRPLVKSEILEGRLWSYRDITKQRQTEEKLRNQKNILNATLESVSVGILLVDMDVRAIDWNSSFYKMWGIPEEVMATKDGTKFIGYVLPYLKDPEGFMRGIEKATQSTADTFEIIELINGQIIERTSFPLIKNEVLDGRVWCFRDITKEREAENSKRELQNRLENAERLESLGQLAGGVAHDLNNMLGPVVGYSEMLLNELPANSKSSERAAKIKKSAEQAASVIQDLLTLARRGKYEMRLLNINDVVKEYESSPSFESLSAKFPHIKPKFNLSKEVGKILGSAPHLSKVLMNLVTNAYEAMPTNGELTITTDNLRTEKGEYVTLKVKDNGHGIAEEDLEKIFEPFYSKKKMDASGTGLGLSVVWGVIKDHKGMVDVQSQIGQGSEFTLFFPEAHGANAPEAGVQFRVVGGSETILAVEVSSEQRELLHEIIDNLGYFVVTASDGRSAVEFVKSHDVDLVVLDMTMTPGFDGLDTYREMLKFKPGQKAIVVSGHVENARVHQVINLGASAFVKKPYNLDTLAIAIREALDKRLLPVQTVKI